MKHLFRSTRGPMTGLVWAVPALLLVGCSLPTRQADVHFPPVPAAPPLTAESGRPDRRPEIRSFAISNRRLEQGWLVTRNNFTVAVDARGADRVTLHGYCFPDPAARDNETAELTRKGDGLWTYTSSLPGCDNVVVWAVAENSEGQAVSRQVPLARQGGWTFPKDMPSDVWTHTAFDWQSGLDAQTRQELTPALGENLDQGTSHIWVSDWLQQVSVVEVLADYEATLRDHGWALQAATDPNGSWHLTGTHEQRRLVVDFLPRGAGPVAPAARLLMRFYPAP